MMLNHDLYYELYRNTDKFIVLITGGRGCEDPETPIMMADLTVKRIKDIKVGDKVMGDDGTPRNVLDVVSGRSMMYKVHQANAEDYIVNDAHIISVKKKPSAMNPYGEITKNGTPRHPNGRYPQYGEYTDMNVVEYMNKSARFKNNFLGYKSNSIPYAEQKVRIEPYFLGLWLGDGTSSCSHITTPEPEIMAYLMGFADRMGVEYREYLENNCVSVHLTKRDDEYTNRLLSLMRGYDLINNKHIPQEYISNSEKVRLELLAGLLDTDGCYDERGDYEITQKNEVLARQIKFLADTLGFRTHMKEKRARIGTKDCGVVYRLQISGDLDRIPCRVYRKKAKARHYGRRSWLVSHLDVEPLGIGEYCGIHLDGNQRYLHADGTVTHNSGKSVASSTYIERLTFELGHDLNGKKIAHQILYSRYTMVSAGMSIIPEVEDKIAADGTGKYFRRSGNDIVNVMTGSHIMFRGIRTSSGNQTAKLKSIKGLTVFVCDEAEEFVSEDDFEKIVFSIRQQGLKNLVIIIMNPTDSNHFIYQKYIKDTHKLVEYDGVPVQISTHPNVLHIHTSYLDNLKYLAPNFIEEAKAMKERDPERYGHIFMGRWSDVAEGAVFKKWGIVKEFPDYCKKVALAMDFGYSTDPTAIVMCGIVDNRLYMKEIRFETGMLSSDIIKVLKPFTAEGIFTYSESADPRLIDEIGLGGVIIYPVQKGAGSIQAGIDKMQTMELFVTEDSINLQEELRNYTWAKDKDDRYTNMPIDKWNHLIDAVRYYVLAVLLGKVMKPKNVTKAQLGIF